MREEEGSDGGSPRGFNGMRLAATGKEKRVRFDRVLWRDEQRTWQATEIELVGTEPIAPELFISDHFGLQVRLKSLTRRSLTGSSSELEPQVHDL